MLMLFKVLSSSINIFIYRLTKSINNEIRVLYMNTSNFFNRELFSQEQDPIAHDNQQTISPWYAATKKKKSKKNQAVEMSMKQISSKKNPNEIKRYNEFMYKQHNNQLNTHQYSALELSEGKKHKTIQSYLQNYYNRDYIKEEIELLQSLPSVKNDDNYFKSRSQKKKREKTESVLPRLQYSEKSLMMNQSGDKRKEQMRSIQPRKYPIIETRSKLNKYKLRKLVPISRQKSGIALKGDTEQLLASGSRLLVENQEKSCKKIGDLNIKKIDKMQTILIEEAKRHKFHPYLNHKQRNRRIESVVQLSRRKENREMSNLFRREKIMLQKNLAHQTVDLSVMGQPTTKIVI